jgi:heavy metal sensor kinase
MSFERLKTWVGSLTVQLMLWNAAAVLLTALAVLIGMREGVRLALLHEIDQVLREDLREISLSLENALYQEETLLRADLDLKARGHAYHGWFVQFLDDQGALHWSSANSPTSDVHLADLELGVPASRGTWRVLLEPLEKPRPSRSAVLVGSSLSSMNADLARVDQLALIMGGGALLVAPLGGYLLARRSTKPFADMIASARRLRPAQLDERLPRRGTSDELDQLAESFNALLDRIGAYWQRNQDSLANAAHELRTPLAAIRSSVEVSLAQERSPGEYRELLADVITETQSLEVLVNQLLLLSAAESDRLQVESEPVRLDELVHKAADMFRGVAETRGILLNVNAPVSVWVEGNRHHLRQVVNNLLDNALKYTSPNSDSAAEPPQHRGPQPRITMTLGRDDDARLAVLTVTDNGVGIAAEHLPRIFDRFFRADSSRPRDVPVSSAGLGLSICRAVVTAHRGTITASSDLGKGSAFTVSLPLKA